MATIDFTKVVGSENTWEYEFEADSDYNLHLEFSDKDCTTRIFQKGNDEEKYVLSWYSTNFLIDEDFVHGIYPKKIKIVCFSKPTVSNLTIDE